MALEVLLLAGGRQKRLGDFVAGTHVVSSNTTTRSWWQDLTTYRVTSYTIYTLLATLCYLLLLRGLTSWMGLETF
ncbi:hypothetical protein [Hymenobacter volaticus]|uniref:MobA-like NTP transferase domain-containing protein n=1 Tax=Hymenobacter volaticus TaxID=2932254 RepID=A0ABY4GGD0_9BACT|nr:hypothetical protein [Hymenobacter volaticus]UOQ69933.1 hypothetical protein MUN86_30550 [Hymenobacter volaticus]